MDVTKKRALSVVRKILAGRAAAPGDVEETPEAPEITPEERGEGDPGETDVAPTPGEGGLSITGRIYFYTAPEGKQINFRNLWGSLSGQGSQQLDDAAKRTLIENLKGGTLVASGGDHFQWQAVMVRATDNDDPNKNVVYYYKLKPWGEVDLGTSAVIGNAGPGYPDIQEFLQQNTLVQASGKVRSMVVLATGSDVVYSSAEPSEQVARRFLSMPPASSVSDTSPDLNHVSPMYRMWVLTGRQPDGGELCLPSGDVSKEDEIGPNRKGQYVGGSAAFQQLMTAAGNPEEEPPPEAPQEEGTQEESLGEMKEKQKEQSPRFEPTDEQGGTSRRREELTRQAALGTEMTGIDGKPLGSEFANPFGPETGRGLFETHQGDPRVNQYEGNGTTMIQDLIRRQHRNMKIFKGATEDKDGYIKQVGENEYTGDNSVMQDLVKLQSKPGGMKIRKEAQPMTGAGRKPVLPVPETEEEAKSLEEGAKEMGKALKKVEDVTGRKTIMAASATRVVQAFMKRANV